MKKDKLSKKKKEVKKDKRKTEIIVSYTGREVVKTKLFLKIKFLNKYMMSDDDIYVVIYYK